jgi:DNA-directed RNA polymerase specialized sigma24 family protein
MEERAALGSWLYRVATNAALIKRRGRRPEREIPLDTQLVREAVPEMPQKMKAILRKFLLDRLARRQ